MNKVTAEDILEKAKKFIGIETSPSKALYPVEYDPIRRFCHSIGDENPLYLDPEYGKSSRFHGTPVPMTALTVVSGDAPRWPPAAALETLPPMPSIGVSGINLSTEWEFFKPVLVGDHISVSERYSDVYIKAIRIDPQAFWAVAERIYWNQNNEMVAVWRNFGLTHRNPEEVENNIIKEALVFPLGAAKNHRLTK